MKKQLINIIILSFIVIYTGCSASKSGVAAKKLSETRLIPVESQTIDIDLDKEQFIKILKEGGENNKVRLVRIYHRGESTDSPPKYRLLDVKPDGIFAYMKLQERDLILAADDYLIPKPILFWEYIKLIPGVGKASIEIEREGNNYVQNYNFVE